MSATTATPTTVTPEHDRLGRVDRRQVLAAFADGHYVEQVFGPDRPLVAASIASHVRGIMPTRGDVVRNAFGYGDERRIRAYQNGREHLLSAYRGYVHEEDFPSLSSDDLPKGE